MAISEKQLAACAVDPVEILRVMGKEPLPWQEKYLRSRRDTLLNIHRKGAKSFTVGVKAGWGALFHDNDLTVIVCPSKNQSQETMRFCLDAYYALGQPVPMIRSSEQRIEFANGSRILCLPGIERTIRTYGPHRIIVDEAARVPDDVYEAVRPMRAYSKGTLDLCSTPSGQRGFFYHEYKRARDDEAAGKKPDFDIIEQKAEQTPWITKEFLAAEARSRGDDFVAQEYGCSFVIVSGVIYPNFGDCLVTELPHDICGEPVGGIDWGWQDPFAAFRGILEHDSDILWITRERYVRHCPLHEHARILKSWDQQGETTWVSDPRSPASVRECRAAGLNVRPAKVVGKQEIETGIAAVTARIKTGRLKVLAPTCKNMIEESRSYKREDEEDDKGHRPPIDGFNHLMDALRYCVTWIDRANIGRLRLEERADLLAQAVAEQQEYAAVAAMTKEERWQERRPWKTRAEYEAWAIDQPEQWIGDDD